MSERGVFWLIDYELLAVLYSDEITEGLSKSCGNYNHKLLWNIVKPAGCSKPYNYYPRGRVEISSKGLPLVYMSICIGPEFIPLIMERFNLPVLPKIHYDGSMHYKCHLDEDYPEL